jgi:ribose transport system permease protein
MIVGELDLSVGAIASLGTITTGMMLADWNLPLPVAVLLGVGIGTFVGFLNGFITVKIGIPAFITTLAMLFLARGISYVLSGGDPVYPLPQNTGDLSRPMILGFPSVVWIFLILFMLADQFVRRSVLGRKFYLIGGNQVAARLSGIKVDKIKIGLFMLCGALSAFAGILLMSKLQRSDPVTGLGWELSVIAAAAVGGIKLTGGGGSLTGAFIGLLFLQVILQGLVMMGLNPFLLEAVVGAVMIIAVWIATLKSKK